MSDYYHPYAEALSSDEMKVNAAYFASYLLARGWTIQAICAALGNWESESTLNPNRPQSGYVSSYPNGTSGGFGLPQWTPYATKIHWYANQQGVTPTASDDNPVGTFEFQMEFHEYECTYGHQGSGKHNWYSNHGYSYSWSEFKSSTDDPSTLAKAYYWQYERSGANDPGSRPSQANAWYEYLTSGELPDVPIDPDDPIIDPEDPANKRKGMSKLLLFAIATDYF